MVFWNNIRRLLSIGRVLFGHGLAYLIGNRFGRLPKLIGWLPPTDLTDPERLRTILEDLGGTFIKLGQMLALQPDVLSFAYCNALFSLLDRVAPFEYEKVEQIIIDDLGRRPLEIFESFDEQPIATASIGQVHVAYLDGRKLVVKVQRPEVETDFMGDIRLMTTALRLIKVTHLSSLDWLIEPISEFVNWTQEELDYRHEARYMEQLRQYAQDNPCERVPMVYRQYSTRRVLVLEFFDGVTIIDYLRALETGDPSLIVRLKAIGFDPDQLARNIIDNFLGDAFKYGLFHADLHPANLIIMPGNQVGYVDFGITGMLSHYARRELVSLTLAYTQADLDSMCESFFKVSLIDENSDTSGFRQGLQRYADEWYEARGNRQRLRKNFTLVMLDMLRLSRRTGVWPERDVIKYIRSSIAIDGLITRFAPGFDVGAYLESTCARHLKQARQSYITSEALVDWSLESGHLIRDGLPRVVDLLGRLSDSNVVSERVNHGNPKRQQALHMGIVVFAVSLLMTVTEEPILFGFNLFTVEILLLAVLSVMLVWIITTQH